MAHSMGASLFIINEKNSWSAPAAEYMIMNVGEAHFKAGSASSSEVIGAHRMKEAEHIKINTKRVKRVAMLSSSE